MAVNWATVEDVLKPRTGIKPDAWNELIVKRPATVSAALSIRGIGVKTVLKLAHAGFLVYDLPKQGGHDG
jgi:hypothetical protein